MDGYIVLHWIKHDIEFQVCCESFWTDSQQLDSGLNESGPLSLVTSFILVTLAQRKWKEHSQQQVDWQASLFSR